MPKHWIVKTEPTTYGYDQLEKEKTTVWDGVRNALALKHIAAMRRGDRVLVYHSGKDKAVVGRAEVASDPYPDPKAGDPKMVVVDLKAAGRLARPVTLAQIKADGGFKDLALVRMPRLSVMPASKEQWERLVRMGA